MSNAANQGTSGYIGNITFANPAMSSFTQTEPPERRPDLWEKVGWADRGVELWDLLCDAIEEETQEAFEEGYKEGYEDGAYEEAMGDDL